MYASGDGVKRDKTEAQRYYQLAADQGDANSLYTLGMERLREATDTKNETALQLAADYIIRSADMGHAIAQNEAGRCYLRGIGVEADKEKAFAYFKQAADRGWLGGLYNVGAMYNHGEGVAQNLDEALRYYKMAADKGDDIAQFWAAKLSQEVAAKAGQKGTSTEAAHYFKLAAVQGHRYSAFKVAEYNLVHDKEGNSRDVDEGLRYLYFALRHGEPCAQTLLANCLLYGRGMKQDNAEALRLLWEAAEQGSSMAYQLLAHLHRFGEHGVPQSAEKHRGTLISLQNKKKAKNLHDSEHPRPLLLEAA